VLFGVGLIGLIVLAGAVWMIKRWGRGALLAVTITVAVLVAAFAAQHFRSQIAIANTDMSADRAHRTQLTTYRLINDGATSATIRTVDARAAGVTVLGVQVDRRRIDSGQLATITIRYKVIDCTAAPNVPIPLRLRISNLWGTHSSTVRDKGFDFTGTPRDACA
jgi:hypothetical protein